MAADALPPVTLVLGGARSGKSVHAEGLVAAAAARAVYVATAGEARDEEMRGRIAAHKARRGAERWRLVEAPLRLPEALGRLGCGAEPILLDCLSLWLANLLEEGCDVAAEGRRLIAALQACRVPVVCVSAEVGMGMTPLHPLGREFRDRLGALNRDVASVADDVIFVLAGLPMRVKAGTAEQGTG